VKKKQEPMVLFGSVLTAALLYAALQLILAALVVSAAFPERYVRCAQISSAFLAAFLGGMTAGRKTHMGTMVASLLAAGGLALLSVLAGLLLWDRIRLPGEGIYLLSAMLAGGILSGLAAGRCGKRRRKGVHSRPPAVHAIK